LARRKNNRPAMAVERSPDDGRSDFANPVSSILLTNDKQEITAPNGRTLEVLPQQTATEAAGTRRNMAGLPVDETGFNPQSNSYVPLVRFSVGAEAAQGREATCRKARREEVNPFFDSPQRPLRVEVRVHWCYGSCGCESCLFRHLRSRAVWFEK